MIDAKNIPESILNKLASVVLQAMKDAGVQPSRTEESDREPERKDEKK